MNENSTLIELRIFQAHRMWEKFTNLVGFKGTGGPAYTSRKVSTKHVNHI